MTQDAGARAEKYVSLYADNTNTSLIKNEIYQEHDRGSTFINKSEGDNCVSHRLKVTSRCTTAMSYKEWFLHTKGKRKARKQSGNLL
jgi:hypothetical protein